MITKVNANLVRAFKALQAANLRAVTSGEGRGLTVYAMAALIDRELGFTGLYRALEAIIDERYENSELDPLVNTAREALAKARGELAKEKTA